MKYLKTFENNLFKKYIVWDDKSTISSNCYIILKIISQDINDWVRVLRCHMYDENGKEILNIGNDNYFTLSSEMIKNHDIYQSDNIEDCRNYIELKIITNKYNI